MTFERSSGVIIHYITQLVSNNVNHREPIPGLIVFNVRVSPQIAGFNTELYISYIILIHNLNKTRDGLPVCKQAIPFAKHNFSRFGNIYFVIVILVMKLRAFVLFTIEISVNEPATHL